MDSAWGDFVSGEKKTVKFRGKEFVILRGFTHPEYSVNIMGEEEELREKLWDVKSGEVVFDIGASYGAYTLSALSVGARVYAFEPEKTVFPDLVRNVTVNHWLAKSYLFNEGLWDKSAQVDMKTYAPHWPAQTITGMYSMRTLDDVAVTENLKRLDWIKVDVEGAEANVLRGGLETIKKFGPKLLIECHVFLDDKITEEVKGLLTSVRPYDFEEIPRPPCTMLFATPRTGKDSY